MTKELAGGSATALEFEANGLGRWDSALMVRILAVHDACVKAGIEFRAQTLPADFAKLISLAQAVP
jgi:ABC-type transporter Mla MlaB component